MRKRSICAGIGLAALITLLSGCAGSENVLTASGTRGEGNIPVGRVQDPKIQRASLKITDSLGTTVTVESDSEGIFYAPQTPYGEVEYTITPVDTSLQPTSFSAMIGIEQNGVFLADPLPKSTTAVVDSITLEFPGRPEIRVGQTAPIKVTIKGKNIGGIKPLIWLDGGVGTLNPGNNLIATMPGAGAVNASLLGVQTRLEFIVHPQ